MGRGARVIVVGLSAAALAAAAACWLAIRQPVSRANRVLAALDGAPVDARLKILNPLEGTLFPPDLAPPVFQWEDSTAANEWLIAIKCAEGGKPMAFSATAREWSPKAADWEIIKRRSLEKEAWAVIVGWEKRAPERLLARGQVRFRTSKDPVGASLFYREVNLPFIDAVKDPSRIRWRFGPVSSLQPPPAVLEGLPVCGNCHSFPRDGRLLAMDVDYANTKGSYVITQVARQMALMPSDVITWDDYRREDGEQTFGLLSQVSPDGNVVISTVKDRSVFVPKPDLEFSQLFFPIKGILAVYDRRTRAFQALPGADNPEYVQSNPAWSPDGKWIVFARAKAHQLRKEPEKGRALLTPEECEEFLKEGKPFQFDLYRIPYNEGRGGKAEPLEGAAANGFSNFFPKYSPDGQWIIFCRARNYMLLQPDSELYIIPARGGPARRLAGNTGRMNSWHSWSPNGRWLVFASKAYSPYTQLCLTHLDEQGNSSPAVRLSRLVAPGRAANIPEFVSLPPAAIQHIEARFLNDYSHARAGYVCERTGDFDAAIKEYRQALALNPQNPHAHERLGYVLYHHQRDPQQGLKHCREAVRLAPRNGQARFILGTALFNQNQVREAVDQLAAALELFPATPAADPQYNLAELHRRLGLAQLLAEDYPASAQSLAEAVRLKLEDPELRFSLAVALAHQGFIEEPLEQYLKAVALSPQMGRLPQLYDLLGANCAKAGRYAEAIDFAEKALRRARDANRADLAAEFGRRLAAYKEKLAKP